MSLQEIKAHLIETISKSDDVEKLERVSDYMDRTFAPAADREMTEADWAAIEEGENQIERGEYVTLEELDTSMRMAVEEGLRMYRQKNSQDNG